METSTPATGRASHATLRKRNRTGARAARRLACVVLATALLLPCAAKQCFVRAPGLDVCLALDTSRSISLDDFDLERRFALRIYDRFDNHDTRIMTSVFNAGSKTVSKLTSDFEAGRAALRAYELSDFGSTNIANALESCAKELLAAKTATPDRKRIILLVSDGAGDSGPQTQTQTARDLEDDSIVIATIGINEGGTGDVDALEAVALRAIASTTGEDGGKLYFRAAIDDLPSDQVVLNVVEATCNSVGGFVDTIKDGTSTYIVGGILAAIVVAALVVTTVSSIVSQSNNGAQGNSPADIAKMEDGAAGAQSATTNAADATGLGSAGADTTGAGTAGGGTPGAPGTGPNPVAAGSGAETVGGSSAPTYVPAEGVVPSVLPQSTVTGATVAPVGTGVAIGLGVAAAAAGNAASKSEGTAGEASRTPYILESSEHFDKIQRPDAGTDGGGGSGGDEFDLLDEDPQLPESPITLALAIDCSRVGCHGNAVERWVASVERLLKMLTIHALGELEVGLVLYSGDHAWHPENLAAHSTAPVDEVIATLRNTILPQGVNPFQASSAGLMTAADLCASILRNSRSARPRRRRTLIMCSSPITDFGLSRARGLTDPEWKAPKQVTVVGIGRALEPGAMVQIGRVSIRCTRIEDMTFQDTLSATVGIVTGISPSTFRRRREEDAEPVD